MNNFYRVHLCINYFYRAIIWFGNGTDGGNWPAASSPKISLCLALELSAREDTLSLASPLSIIDVMSYEKSR
jgi:hypothetical protein